MHVHAARAYDSNLGHARNVFVDIPGWLLLQDCFQIHCTDEQETYSIGLHLHVNRVWYGSSRRNDKGRIRVCSCIHAQSNHGDASSILSFEREGKGNCNAIRNVIKMILAQIFMHNIHSSHRKQMVQNGGAQPIRITRPNPKFCPSILALTLGTSASRLISVELLETLCKLSELCTPATWDYKPRHSDVSARQYTPEHWMWSVGDKMLRCAMFWKQQRKFDHLLKRPLVATNHKKRVEIRGHISNVVCTGTYTHMRYGFACWAWVCEEFDEYYVYTNFEYIRPSTRALLLSISSVCFCFLYVHQFKRWVKSNSSGRGVKVCLCGWARAWICPIIFPKTNRIPLSSRQYTKLHSSTHL